MKEYHIPVLIIVFFVLSVNSVNASILYTIPVDPPYIVKDIQWPYSADGTAGEDISKAVKDYETGRYTDALGRLQVLMKSNTGNDIQEAGLLYTGSIYFKEVMLGDKPEDKPGDKRDNRSLMKALDSYKESIRRYPESKNVPAVLIESGRIYMEMNLVAEAKGSFKRVLNAYPSTTYAAEARYQLALAYEKEGNYEEAIDEYRILSMSSAVEMEKNGLFGMAGVFFILHEFGDAKRLYEGGLVKWPSYVKGHPEILFNYSECEFQNGEFHKAREGFLALYNIYPDDKKAGFALTRVGESYLMEKRVRVAENIYGHVVELFPKSEDSYSSKLAIGDIKFLKATGELEYHDVANIYNEVEKLSGNEPLSLKARFKTGKVFEVRKEYKKALSIYNELLERTDGILKKEVSGSFNNLAERLGNDIREKIIRHDYISAVKDYQSYFRQFTDHITNEEFLIGIAEAHKNVHLYNEASDIYQEIIKRGSANSEMALFKAGELYYQSGDFMRSAETFGKYIVDFPKGREVINARALLGESFYKLKDYEKSANSFYAVIREAPYRYPGVYLNLSRILLRTRQYEDSVNILTDLIRHFPTGGDIELLSQAYIELGGAYYGMERYHEALISYRTGIEKARGREGAEMVRFMIGDCLFMLNKKDDAKDIFTRLSKESTGLVKEYSQEKLKDIAMNISM